MTLNQCAEDYTYNLDIVQNILNQRDLLFSPIFLQICHQFSENSQSNLEQNPLKQFEIEQTSTPHMNYDPIQSQMFNFEPQNQQNLNILLKQKRRNSESSQNTGSPIDYSQVLLRYQRVNQSESSNNIPKFLLKMFLKYFKQDYGSISLGSVANDFDGFARKLKSKNRSGTLQLLFRVLNKQFSKNDHTEMSNRKLLWYILGKRKRQEVLMNKKIIKKQLYSTAAKLYRLRCCSSTLIKRTSIK